MEVAKDLFIKKNEFLETYCEEVNTFDFYRDLFPVGTFERKGHLEDNKPNGILIEFNDDGKAKRETVTDELESLCKPRKGFTIFSPISYYGYQRSGVNARFIYAMAFDLDGVGMPQIRDLLHQMKNDVIPTATYIANSGNGLHLYYVFKEPIPMYPQNQKYLKAVKYALTKRIWNGYTSTIEQPQLQGVLQGFRLVGSPTKFGTEYPVRVFRHGNRFAIQELIEFIPDIDFSGLNEIRALEKQSKMSLEQAKKKYPEWYERRIEKGEKRGRWIVKRDLYDWWLARIRKEIQVGHRYYGIMTLAIYAKKCGIDEDELRKDAFSLLEPYESKTVDDNNHFEKQHIIDALELYNEDYITFPRDDISKLTGLRIDPNKRNGRKQLLHIKYMNLNRKFKFENGECTNGGRPSAEQAVIDYLLEHPMSKKSDIIRATGLSKKTVYKHYPTAMLHVNKQEKERLERKQLQILTPISS